MWNNILVSLAALDAKISPSEVKGLPTGVTADGVVSGVLTTVYVAGGIVAVIIMVVAGLLYVTSNGDPTKTKRAREAIIYAGVGIVVILMAFVITNFVIGKF